MPLSGFAIFVVVLIVFAILLIFMGVKTVPQGNQFTVERFGRYTHTLMPGLHFIIPVIDRIGHRLNVMEQVLDVPSQEVITRDNAMVTVDGVIFYQILDSAKSAYEVRNLERAVINLTMTNIRTVMGDMDLDQLLSQRDQINARLLTVVDEATEPWGVKLTRIEIRDIQPPVDLVTAMARQMKAEREKRAAILEAEGFREAAIRRAEGEKQGQILEAEGRREAAFRDAEARERYAEAEATATNLVSEAIAKGEMQAINYFVAPKYVEALKEFAKSPNQKVFFLPVEATGILSSLGGITELIKNTGVGSGGSSGSGSGGSSSGGGARSGGSVPSSEG